MTSTKSLFAFGLMAAVFYAVHPGALFAQGSFPDSTITSGELGPDSTITPGELGPDSLLSTSQLRPDSSLTAAPPPAVRHSDVLPFAKNDLPRRSFALGFGGGIGTYVADLGDVDQAFRQIEDAFASAGVPLARKGPAKLDPMRMWFATLHFENVMDVSMQLGRSDGTSDQLRTTGVLLSRRILSSSGGDLALTAGVGGGTYGFVFTRGYGTTLRTNSDGSYDTLDSITLEGGGSYWTGKGSFLLRPGDHVAIDVQAQYLGMSEASTDTRAGRISMNLSGCLFGASLTLFL